MTDADEQILWIREQLRQGHAVPDYPTQAPSQETVIAIARERERVWPLLVAATAFARRARQIATAHLFDQSPSFSTTKPDDSWVLGREELGKMADQLARAIAKYEESPK